MPPITKEVLVGYSSYWLRALLLLRAAPCKPLPICSLLTKVSVFELALTPECQSDLVPGDRFAYASPNRSFPMRLTWDMSVHAQLAKPAHTALCSCCCVAVLLLGI